MPNMGKGGNPKGKEAHNESAEAQNPNNPKHAASEANRSRQLSENSKD